MGSVDSEFTRRLDFVFGGRENEMDDAKAPWGVTRPWLAVARQMKSKTFLANPSGRSESRSLGAPEVGIHPIAGFDAGGYSPRTRMEVARSKFSATIDRSGRRREVLWSCRGLAGATNGPRQIIAMNQGPLSHEPDHSPDPSATDHPLFSARASTLVRCGLIGAVVLVTATGIVASAYYHSGYWDEIGFAPRQPVQFSHRHHAGELLIHCRFCHTTVETSAFAEMPSTQTCLSCHSQIFTNTPMLQPVIESAARNAPLQWSRVTRMPDHVFFNHGIHVNKGVAASPAMGKWET